MIRQEGRRKREEGREEKYQCYGTSKWQACVNFFLPSSLFLLLSQNASADDIRDVRPPVDVPGSVLWLWITVIIAVALIALLGIYLMKSMRVKKIVVPKTPWEIAYERLAEFERKNLLAQGKVKEYYVELSDIARRYIEGRFNIDAPEMTTEEFLNSVRSNSLIGDRHKDILKQFLILSDMVKFAKYGPNALEAAESLRLAKRFVDDTKIADIIQDDQDINKPAAG